MAAAFDGRRPVRTAAGWLLDRTAVGRPLALRVVVPVDFPGEMRFLQLRQSVPVSFAQSAEAVEAAYRDYRELAISREGLKRIYIVTLTFALLMALFVAVAVAATQSGLLAEPLANLAQATQAVARGDFSRRAPVTSRDELGVLTESFNSMTRQLEEARRGVESNQLALEAAKARLENILANLSAGVLVFDHALELSISNHGAAAILGTELDAFAAQMRAHFAAQGDADWQLELQLKGTGKTLHARGARLPQVTGGGAVLVFDDITRLIQAQRATAWAEVARRLAHEIKNPLTPIQLSAEHIRRVHAEQNPDFPEVLETCLRTIMDEVATLRQISAEFSAYARIPTPRKEWTDMSQLLQRVVRPYQTAMPPGTGLELDIAPDLPPIEADRSLLTRAFVNLIENALQAMPRGGRLCVRARGGGEEIVVDVSDTGLGMDAAAMARLFEPYFSTKDTGTGLGLAIARKAVEEHGGRIEVSSAPQKGTTMRVVLPVARRAGSPPERPAAGGRVG